MVATGGKILATDYNSMRTNVTGILVALWGQSATSSNVSATVDSVTEDQLFDLYIDIAKYSCNGIPNILLQNDIFKKYRTKKRYFPKRDFYGMD